MIRSVKLSINLSIKRRLVTGYGSTFLRNCGWHCILMDWRGTLRLQGVFSLHTADGGANRDARLIFCNRFGQNQLSAQTKCGRQAGAAIDNRDWNGAACALAVAADIEDELGGRKVLAIDEHEIEAIGIQ